MKYLIMVAAAAGLLLNTATLVDARTIKSECQAQFEGADKNNDGILTSGEPNPFAKPVEAVSSLSQVSEEEFMAQCGAHVLQTMPANQLAMVFLLVSASAGATSLLSPE